MATGGQAKLKEGDKLIVEAEICLKTSWLKWTPDYAGAAHAFDKAALCYRNAKAYDKARDAYERAAEVHYKNTAPFQAGRSLEQAAHVSKELQLMEQAAMLLEKASGYYHESGHGDTAGQVLTKAAKLVDAVNPRRAADYHLACAELHLIEDKQREAANATRRAVNMSARARDLDKLREALEKLRGLYEDLQLHKQLWNVAAIEVVLHLHLDDTVAAQDTLRDAVRIPGFLESDEGAVLQTLCESFSERDGEAVVEACNNVVFRTMETDVAKLALDLKKKFEYSSPAHSSSSPPAALSSSNTKPATPTTSSAPAGQRKPVTFSDMKAELFGGAGNSGSRKKRVAVEKEEEEDERDLSAVLSGEDREVRKEREEGGGEIEAREEGEEGGGEIEAREEGKERGGEIKGGEEGEGGEDEDEQEGDVYGGLLT